MLQIKNITKKYRVGELEQTALDNVSLNLRDNEFISVLGPSGSGKTTLLNIIGGLDSYDSGDLVIDGVSTKKYNSRDWDTYRNHTIGFVFQSYNLIPHQSVLSNVELALTIGGIKGKEKRKRAEEALKEVGLEEHMHKKPNQLSGGQMQRVAIARALVNDPKILLADEPTGALDTETGIQVMEILKKVAEKRLVVMVTHNPELADKYSTRIVKLRDGKIVDDSDPLTISAENEKDSKNSNKKHGKSKMSFFTSLSLSFNNLRTKKMRTMITSIAGSIGIIGIALILALSNGVNLYISQLQKDTMENYPITINSVEYVYDDSYNNDDDIDDSTDEDTLQNLDNVIFSSVNETNEDDSYQPTVKKNDLSSFKKFLDKPENKLSEYIGTGSVILEYDTRFFAYTDNTEGKLINTSNNLSASGEYYGVDGYTAAGFIELPQGMDSTISQKTVNSYDLIYGDWPENEDECVIIANPGGFIDAKILCQLGYISTSDYVRMVNNNSLADNGTLGTVSYEDICKKEFTILPTGFRYEKNDRGTFDYIKDSSKEINNIIDKYGIKLKVKGIITQKPSQNSDSNLLQQSFSNYSDTPVVGYTYKLTNKIIDVSSDCDVINAQKSDTSKNIITGIPFEEKDKNILVKAIKNAFKNMDDSTKIQFVSSMFGDSNPNSGIGEGEETEYNPINQFDKWLEIATDDQIFDFYDNAWFFSKDLNTTLYEIGYVAYENPTSIVIYPDSFDGKEGILKLLDEYNDSVGNNEKINYVDYIKDITDRIASMINTISYILIAFVAVSLVVSCIMIGIITHISVLERTKEIGILRALGASKGNISQVFNAETFIIGLLSGVIGIVAAALFCIPANAVIGSMGIVESGAITVSLPVLPSIILIIISTFITMIGGFIPAKCAARKDPVVALRTE